MIVRAEVTKPKRFEIVNELAIDWVAPEAVAKIKRVPSHVNREKSKANYDRRPAGTPKEAKEHGGQKDRHDRKEKQQVARLRRHPTEATLRKNDDDEQRAAAEVRAGEGCVALYINPVQPEDVFRVTAAGDVMPQKSTFYYPKIPTGLVFRMQEDA